MRAPFWMAVVQWLDVCKLEALYHVHALLLSEAASRHPPDGFGNKTANKTAKLLAATLTHPITAGAVSFASPKPCFPDLPKPG